MNKEILVRWELNSYYSFHEALFTIESKYLDWIKDKKVIANFGEIEGRYSEVYYEFDIEDFTIINCSENFISDFKKFVGDIGLNPFESYGIIKNSFENINEYIDITIKEQLDKIHEEN